MQFHWITRLPLISNYWLFGTSRIFMQWFLTEIICGNHIIFSTYRKNLYVQKNVYRYEFFLYVHVFREWKNSKKKIMSAFFCFLRDFFYTVYIVCIYFFLLFIDFYALHPQIQIIFKCASSKSLYVSIFPLHTQISHTCRNHFVTFTAR